MNNLHNPYYYDFLQQHIDDYFYVDCIKYELDKRIYFYGNHFKYHYERSGSLRTVLNKFYHKNKIQIVNTKHKNLIINNAYFGLDRYITGIGSATIPPPWIGRNSFYDRSQRTIQSYSTYLSVAFSADKIFVSGHPLYGSYEFPKLRFGLDNILVISTSVNGAQHSDQLRLVDRGTLILHLLKIEKALKRIGIKSVRLRVHPSEDIYWYLKHVDPVFFIPDKDNLKASLTKSSLVITPTSTVFLDAMINGVSGVLFERPIDNKDPNSSPLVPPFDKSDERILVAHTEDELTEILLRKPQTNLSILGDYISPNFSIDFMKALI